MATWTAADFSRMRDDRVRHLVDIDKVEGGEWPAVERRIQGRIVDSREEFLAHLKRNVAEIEGILGQNGEPLDA